jgi:hypothetical protein
MRFQFPNQLVLGRAIGIGIIHPNQMKDATSVSMLKGLNRANDPAPIAHRNQEAGAGDAVRLGV